MTTTTLHKAETRGHADHGWLDSHHTFSFANYYDPQRVHFGALRVLNDDIVTGGMGFGTHPHDNMEIISIPLKGALEHKDSMGNTGVITKGEVQVMSAGTGIRHSEFNHSKTEMVNFLQLWIFPKLKNIAPRYDQKLFDLAERQNKIQILVSPDEENTLHINQDAWLSMADLDADKKVNYKIHKPGNGVYIFIIDGNIETGDLQLMKRDGAGITDADEITINAKSRSEILFIEVPMQFN